MPGQSTSAVQGARAASAQQDALGSHKQVLKVVLLCTVYIATSSLLIRFNKFLMDPSRFPYTVALSSMHMGCSLLLCVLLYAVRPTLFPGMAATEGRRLELLRWFLPIGVAFALSLCLSNEAYMYCNVAFLQFMKESNVVICFLFSCAAGLQVMNRLKLSVVAWIMLGSLLCVSHELNFVLLGFLLQLCSQLAECSRVVMGELVLSGSSFKLDPLTYTMFAAPICFATLLVGNVFFWEAEMLHRLAIWWPYLLPNMALAFVLNVLVATIVKELSAVGFILTGLVKDIVLVMVSAFTFHEVVTQTQAFSFTIVLMGVLFWSLMKASPNHPIVQRAEVLCGLRSEVGKPTEATPLSSSKV